MIVRIEGGDQESRSVEVKGAEAVLGKHSASDVPLPDARVSRRHARLVVDGGALWLEDLGSSNGTSVGGKRVAGRVSVAKDDVIEIGPFRLHAEMGPVAVEGQTEVSAISAPPGSGAVAAKAAHVKPAPAASAGGSPDYGPLAELFADERITEIMVNGPGEVFVERGGKLEETTVRFASQEALVTLVGAIASRAGRVIDDGQPMLDARLEDGSRVNAILDPLAVRGPYVTIRRFPAKRLSAEQLVELGTLTAVMLEFLRAAVASRLTILVSGGTGSGKTALLNALSAFAGTTERIVTIEDAAELKLPQRHVLPLETRPPDIRGQGQITTRDLVRNALRMRPDRIVVGEVRGAEALDMLQALNTGHEGSLSTIHANSPREALARLETLCLFAQIDLPSRAIREQITGAVRLIVQMNRGADGKRRLTSVSELTGMEGDQFTIGEIFRCETDAAGESVHRATGYVPRCREVMLRKGQKIDNRWFAP